MVAEPQRQRRERQRGIRARRRGKHRSGQHEQVVQIAVPERGVHATFLRIRPHARAAQPVE